MARAKEKPKPKAPPKRKAKIPPLRPGRKLALSATLLREVKRLLLAGNIERHVWKALHIPEQTWETWRRRGRELSELLSVGQLPKPTSVQQAKETQLLIDLDDVTETARERAITKNVGIIAEAGAKDWRALAWLLAKHDPETYGKEPVDLNVRITEGPWEELHRILSGEDVDGDSTEETPS